MSAHTPGPWLAVPYSPKRFGLGQRGDSAFFLLHCQDADVSHPAAKANARLIAAAPDLLEALERCRWFIENMLEDEAKSAAAQYTASAHAAITKATGWSAA